LTLQPSGAGRSGATQSRRVIFELNYWQKTKKCFPIPLFGNLQTPAIQSGNIISRPEAVILCALGLSGPAKVLEQISSFHFEMKKLKHQSFPQ
jgi:hypothetical protein